ncbi:leishmanolysin family protein, putative [Ichthyophthirius multifiliis]|uniref:Leishmanolysin family protein, putative n=1 Tax=Ichthyophthirius multifiliis TaxID=5932 RepID=G0QMW0_ICHMU|nr:leishmanolysin family protein, putative [Ichthyophthirius multifiliis]EGR33445.1 leishmanolysin family protein, putative [Ichthyophthirius multifiliis]|eukprot:XP_004037431.1 leishmanolysin family protein, putative [Ichthyophthirius multifiliis]
MPQCAKCNNDTSCSSCFDGQYLNIDNCQNCGIAQCQKCKDGISCDLCQSGYFYNNSQCISSCPKGKYADASTRICQDCNSKCATCSNATDCDTSCLFKCATCSNATNCDTCFGNRVVTTCECPAYSYNNLNYRQACIECSTISIGCSTCNATTCQACLSPNFLDGNSCVITCPAGKWPNTANKQCTACLFKCATCSNATDCDTCFGNRVGTTCECPAYSYNNLNYRQACIECSTISIGCSTCNATTCQACLSTHFLDGNSCVIACPAGKWGNTANRQCTACLFKCATCSNATDCDTCFGNRLPQQCDCPQYSYDPNIFNQACTICSTFSAGCVTCSSTECLTCQTPQYFQLNQKQNNAIHAQIQ